MLRTGIVLAGLCAACAHAPAPTGSAAASVRPQPQPTAPPPWYGDLRALAERAARVRGFELTQAFTVAPVDDPAFFAWAERVREPNAAYVDELVETLDVLFIGGAPSRDRASFQAGLGASRDAMKRLQTEGLVAFYDFQTHTLVVRSTRPASLERRPADERAVLSRVVGHVLQDQRGLGATRPSGVDEWLAWNAVLEGDAALTALLVAADVDDLSPRRAVERFRLRQATDGARRPPVLAALPIAQVLLRFPEREGVRFVTDLYAAGGLDLVDAMLRSPPRTTDLVLNPNRYLAGGGPRTARVSATARHLGTVLTMGLLQSCSTAGTTPLPPELLQWLGASLVDDSLERRGDGYVWLTTWDTAETARRTPSAETEEQRTSTLQVATAELRLIAECLGAKRPDLVTSAREVTVALTVKRPDEADALAALPRPKAERARFGSLSIPEPRATVAFHDPGPGRLSGARWEHAPLGLALDFPSGAQLIDPPGSTLMAATPGVLMVGSYLDERFDQEHATEFLRGLTDGLAEAGRLTGAPPTSTRSEWQAVTTKGANAKEVVVRWGAATLVARAYPMCAGRAVFYLVGMSADSANEALRQQWQDSVVFTGPAAACDR
ncbi:MAG: hypothetical protein MUC96_31520 [Myxococcaceae bacterium]|nr:hypothetical protein [Myxococcaceae bacterium]